MKKPFIAVVTIVALGLTCYGIWQYAGFKLRQAARITATSAFLGSPVPARCSLADISVRSLKAKFVNECRRSPCVSLKGVAVLTNRCAEPVGVQVKITAYDKDGAAVATRKGWPASVSSIPPGDYTFSVDHWLDYDPEIKTFDLAPVSVQSW